MRVRARGSTPGLLLPSVALAALALAHAVRVRGQRRGLLFAALGLGTGAAGEYLAVNVARRVRHHGRPQVLGVPVAAVLGWYTITYAAFATVETLVGRLVAARVGWRWSVPLGTAALATSLDLVLDAYGLDQGLWEWTADGAYAREVVGPNGRRGIPVGNVLAWLGMTGGISLAYQLASRELDLAAPSAPVANGRHTGRSAALLLVPFYLFAAAWARRRGRRRYLLSSGLVPVLVVCALAGGIPRRKQQAWRPESR